MSAFNPVIRTATQEDLPAIISLVHELAVYEKSEDKMTAGLDIYQNSFENGHFEAIVATISDAVIGTAIFYRRFSTWKGPILYLEDFVVRETHRRMGVGKLLFEAYVSEARKIGVMCLWQVLDWNQPAIDFYDKYDVLYEDNWLNAKIYF